MLVIMATSIIKVWYIAIEKSDQPLMTSAIAKFPTSNSGITVSQLLWILILASLVNFALTWFDVIGPIHGQTMSITSSVSVYAVTCQLSNQFLQLLWPITILMLGS